VDDSGNVIVRGVKCSITVAVNKKLFFLLTKTYILKVPCSLYAFVLFKTVFNIPMKRYKKQCKCTW